MTTSMDSSRRVERNCFVSSRRERGHHRRFCRSRSECLQANSQSDQRNLERLLVRRHLQPVGGDRANHLLLFLRRLDDSRRSKRTKRSAEDALGAPRHSRGNDPKGRPYADLRWSQFKNFAPEEMFTVVSENVFPFLRRSAAMVPPIHTTWRTPASRFRLRRCSQRWWT